ncbi:MAG: YihY/virulence factor BrkB family protein [Filifactoraceae bacterium]
MFNIKPKKNDTIAIYVIKALIQRYETDRISQIGGQFAYFSILSVFPFLIVVNAVIARLNIPITNNFLEAKELLPPEIIEIVSNYLTYIRHNTGSGILPFGLISTIYLSSIASLALIDAINKAYKTNIHPPFWQKIIIAIIITLTLGLTIIISLVFLTFGEEFIIKTLGFIKLPLNYVRTWNTLRWLFVILILSATLSVIYYILPCKKSKFRLVIPGTIFSVVTFLGMTMIFSIYVNNFGNYSSIYGSLGGIIIFMIWLYSSGIVIVLGAELNHIIETHNLGIYQYDILENNNKLKLKLGQRLTQGISGRPHHYSIYSKNSKNNETKKN